MREIPLSRGRFIALVDDEDYERIAAHRWHRKGSDAFYAVRWVEGNTRRVRMHREVLGVGSDVIVDHANGDGLDNRKVNLRVCTPADNARNSRALRGQRVKGVQFLDGRWRARVRIDGRLTHIGSFGTAVEAALAYDAAARLHFGEFACVNYPLAGERPAIVAA
jgi:hypothetical protein